jgi:Ala-tRNA(Pro) deacylase
MAIEKLREFLDANKAKYELVSHAKAYTAQAIASHAHVPVQQLAKTVIVKIDGNLAMAVLPGFSNVDTGAIQAELGAQSVRVATEFEFKDRFPDCEVGAMPPFGNLYDMPVLVDENLAGNSEIAFNAGSHTELMRLSYQDFVTLVRPRLIRFSTLRVRRAAAGEDRLW